MDDPTDHAVSTDDDLARLRELRPDWHIRHASDDRPGQLGYIASRDGILITAENLVRLGDRIAEADRDRPPAILMTGPPGWVSGPCYGPADPTGPLGQFAGRWQVDVQPAQVPVWCAVRVRGTETRVVVAFTAPELAAKLAAVEAAEGT